jgi:hypothetical protein
MTDFPGEQEIAEGVIEKLKALVESAAARAELAQVEVERLTETLEAIEGWSRAYPIAVFPEPDLAKAHELLQAGGMTLDAISAHAMRHVITQVGKMARAALAAPKGE